MLITKRTELVIKFKRSYRTNQRIVTEDQDLALGIKQLKEKLYGERISEKKIVRVTMLISQEDRTLTKWQVLDE